MALLGAFLFAYGVNILTHVHKHGFTLIELMVVIAIMGILSALGVVGFQSAVENSRVDDAAKNVTAFLERVASESNRISATMCIDVPNTNTRKLNVYKSADCARLNGAPVLFYMELDAPMSFVVDGCSDLDFDCSDDDGCNTNLLSGSNGVFKPRLGLSAAPASGHVCMQYAGKEHYAVALKSNKENFIRALTCVDGECD